MAKITEGDRIERLRKMRQELDKYLELFSLAFDELHAATVEHVKNTKQPLRRYFDYPRMRTLENGFPSFSEVGFHDDKAPVNYLGSLRPQGLAGLLIGYTYPEIDLPRNAELTQFLRTHEVGQRFHFPEKSDTSESSSWSVDQLVGNAVERYLQLNGTEAGIETELRNKVVWPLIIGTVAENLDLRLLVPIALTHFDVDHFKLTDTAYITRIPDKLQLARARISTAGSGAVKGVVGAATHAFVSSEWNIDNGDHYWDLPRSLSQLSENVLDAIDSFFGALRIATGISTGYAQVVWVPKRWAQSYYGDLAPVYGTTTRQYPGGYDNYGWVDKGHSVNIDELMEVRRIYDSIVRNEEEPVRLAIKRLNSSLTRSDAADAVLDGTIGLELLLGDDQNQSLAYKLRLRAGVLTKLASNYSYSSSEIAEKVKRLYDVRSAIVHGKRKKPSKKASEPADKRYVDERAAASELLRYVLDILLSYPEYQDPSKIDAELLLGAVRDNASPTETADKSSR